MTKKKPETTDPSILLRELGGKPLHRSMAVDHSTLDVDARTVEVAVSSEYPVRRWFGMEILDHSPESVSLARMNAGAPLLDMHDRWTQIGVVEEAWLDDDKKLRARVRFSKNAHAEEVWQDVVDKIRQNISVGYDPQEMVLDRTEGDLKYYRVTRWEPYEVSSVSIPADPTVGVDRALPEPVQVNQPVQGIEMPKENTNGLPDTAAVEANERQRSADIFALCQRHGAMDMIGEALSGGLSADQVRAKILDKMNPNPTSQAPDTSGRNGDLPSFREKIDVTARGLGLSDKERRGYSLLRALNAAANGDWKEAGLEKEVNIAIADATGKEARGIYIPHDLLAERVGMTTGAGAGGELVANELRVDQFIDMVRNKAVMGHLGARVLGGLQGDVSIPKKVAGANFYWIPENGTVPLSKMDLTNLPLKPKTIAGAIAVSRKLRLQSSMSVEALIISDLINGLAVALDRAMLFGSGEDSEPLGLYNQSGVPGLEYGAGGILFDDLVDMETSIATFNGDVSAMKYLTSVTQRGYAKKRKEDPDSSDSTKIWRNNEVNGYDALATNQVKGDSWAFGDWSQAIVALWGALDLKPDPYAQADSDGLVVRVFQDADAGYRNLSSFCLAKKKKAA
ncbi:phage major capsid protein [Pseudomonas sp. MWU12-2345]|uniref:phage major capsid protein n=1 Tax=Pseudomonas sp. MWU12-2345 TaxID=2928689 RepID=UPI00200F4080|nr:phage major capsid protein [Pseudomonas sp. MWU12-2345]